MAVSREGKTVQEDFWSWLAQQTPARNTWTDKAVNYVLNRRDTAETCLFSNSIDGVNANAVVYTMVEMAKAHRLNVYRCLKFLLEYRPSKFKFCRGIIWRLQYFLLFGQADW